MTTQPQGRLRPFQPTAFGGYLLVSPLATGGMGELFLALLRGSSTPCVIKKILPHLASGPDLLQRFVHEAKALAQLSHESIARVLDMGIQEGRPYLVLEYVDGKDLRKVAARCRERGAKMPPALVLHVMGRVLDALAYAHNKRGEDGKEIQLVHRDVSPPNILIAYDGGVKVIDFGLAKSTLHSAKTHPSLLVGKFLYMSPEQARHQPVDRRSDLYSVGVCLYEMLLGLNPFDGLAPTELLALVTNPTFLEKRPPEGLLPDRLAATLRRALAVEAAERFQTAEEFRDELLACQTELDKGAGQAQLAQWMQQTFTQEYAAERRLLRNASEAWIPEGHRETGIHRAPNLHPTPQSVAARPTPAGPQARTTPGTREVVPLSFAPVPRSQADSNVGAVADAPTTPGVRYGEVETQPELKVPPSADTARTPAAELPAYARNTAPQAVPIPRLVERSSRFLVAPVLAALSLLAAYLCWDLYRTGFFHSAPAAERQAWTATDPDPDAEHDDNLAPLVIGLSNGPAGSPLGASFQQLRQQFTHFKHAFGCGGGRAALCRRYEVLSTEVQAAIGHADGHNEELLKRVRELSSDLTEAQRGL
jgi:hypothetical protein